jgi:antitoxin ParD1/3/4
MATMNISLPDPLKEFVESRVSDGQYSTSSEYFRELVRADQKRLADERLDALVTEGLESGDFIEVTPEFWRSLRSRIEARRHTDAIGGRQ